MNKEKQDKYDYAVQCLALAGIQFNNRKNRTHWRIIRSPEYEPLGVDYWPTTEMLRIRGGQAHQNWDQAGEKCTVEELVTMLLALKGFQTTEPIMNLELPEIEVLPSELPSEPQKSTTDFNLNELFK
jgi:hypothetical protein